MPCTVGMRVFWSAEWLLLTALCFPARSAEPPPQRLADPNALEEVVVEGERPGPGIWQVSAGEHSLWILPSLEPLPKKMLWRSQVVEQRIAQSQVVLAPPTISADVGFFRGITLIPSLLHAEKSPDGQKLEQVLPHDVYIRWLALRVKYLGSGDDENKRPMVAAFDLYRHAIDHAGLTSEAIVWDAIEKLAKKARVPIQPIVVTIPVKDPKASIRELEKIPRAAEIECFTKTIDRLETDLLPMVKRANFWSLGDITGLKSLPCPDERTACINAFLTAPRLREQFEQAYSLTENLWLATADKALEKNASTFAVVPLTVFLQKDGVLDKLRAKGYTIKAP
jgi:TraB/PrgY/gumN family